MLQITSSSQLNTRQCVYLVLVTSPILYYEVIMLQLQTPTTQTTMQVLDVFQTSQRVVVSNNGELLVAPASNAANDRPPTL